MNYSFGSVFYLFIYFLNYFIRVSTHFPFQNLSTTFPDSNFQTYLSDLTYLFKFRLFRPYLTNGSYSIIFGI